MYYLRARYFDPQTGRFTSFDIQEGTVDASQNLNRYYSKNGGTGGNRPDAKLLLKANYGLHYPIFSLSIKGTSLYSLIMMVGEDIIVYKNSAKVLKIKEVRLCRDLLRLTLKRRIA